MKTKTRPARTVRDWYYRSDNYNGSTTINYRNWNYGPETITYGTEHRLPNGRYPWKECVHTLTGMKQPYAGELLVSRPYEPYFGRNSVVRYRPYRSMSNPGAFPEGSWDTSVLSQVHAQLDLNCSDAVLLYSGVLQAVPLLGSVFKFNQILRNVSQHVSKSMRRKPFTTVMQDLISADFINRFVIGPTLDDVRKFQDAVDYSLRVIQTAHERNAHAFALDSASTDVVSEKVNTGSSSGGPFRWTYKLTTRKYTTSKAFMLLSAEYDMSAVSPLKVWAQRVGLTRPLDSVWDLVPFSFVIDYFTRAGDFISGLSDEMSTVDGLRGRITAIHDLWATFKQCSECRFQITDYSSVYPGALSYTKQDQVYANEQFRRFRVPDPWLAFLTPKALSDYLEINTSISSTKKRTLAELFIQARLRKR